MTPSRAARLAENIAAIRDRIRASAERSGRNADDVRLIAVTKYVNAELTAATAEAGCLDLGESRPQDLGKKAELVKQPNVRWHLIGHLQRNKVRRTLPVASLIHSADSLRLIAEIDREAAALEITVAVLLEVNVSRDETKHGFHPHEMRDVYRQSTQFSHINVQGLMTMASREGDLEQARREFRSLRAIRDQLLQSSPNGPPLAELSMGMSGDFEVAIEEGATMVRVGSALFEGMSR